MLFPWESWSSVHLKPGEAKHILAVNSTDGTNWAGGCLSPFELLYQNVLPWVVYQHASLLLTVPKTGNLP